MGRPSTVVPGTLLSFLSFGFAAFTTYFFRDPARERGWPIALEWLTRECP